MSGCQPNEIKTPCLFSGLIDRCLAPLDSCLSEVPREELEEQRQEREYQEECERLHELETLLQTSFTIQAEVQPKRSQSMSTTGNDGA